MDPVAPVAHHVTGRAVPVGWDEEPTAEHEHIPGIQKLRKAS
jgi:hypothetical protein